MDEIQEYKPGGISSAKAAEKYRKLLNKKPRASKIKSNKYANNAKYLPIADAQMTADQLFIGQWSVRIISTPYILGNSICATVEVDYLDPVTNNWLTKGGTAAVAIQTDQDGRALGKAVEKAAPAALSRAERNALQRIGKIFGRDLNRADAPEFVGAVDRMHEIVNAGGENED